MNDRDKIKSSRYLEYLLWAQGDCRTPLTTYTDWSGCEVLCYNDWLKKNIDILTDEELEDLATKEQKQMALSVAIDAYDKTGTYFDELRKLLKL